MAGAGAAAAAVAEPAATAAPEPMVDLLLARTATYLADDLAKLSSVVAEESYEQTLRQPTNGRDRFRSIRLRSDFLLVQVPGTRGLTPFRDVFEVDGKTVRDRDDRLQKLFIEMPPGAADTARRVLDEGARYNLGSIHRNINQPMLALGFLQPDVRGGFRFTYRGEELVDGVSRIGWTTSKSAARRSSGRHEPVVTCPRPVRSGFDRSTGRVVRSVVTTTDGLFTMESTVVFRVSDTLGLSVPAEMRENYSDGVREDLREGHLHQLPPVPGEDRHCDRRSQTLRPRRRSGPPGVPYTTRGRQVCPAAPLPRVGRLLDERGRFAVLVDERDLGGLAEVELVPHDLVTVFVHDLHVPRTRVFVAVERDIDLGAVRESLDAEHVFFPVVDAVGET